MRLTTVLATAALTGAAGTAAAFAAADAAPPRPPAKAAAVHVRVTPATVHRGGVITAIGSGWPASRGVEILIGPPYSEADHVTWARATRAGTFRVRIRARATSATGRWVLLACRRACRIKASASYRVIR